MLMMVLTLIGMSSNAAVAAPGGPGGDVDARSQVAGLTADVCIALLNTFIIDADGDVIAALPAPGTVVAGVTLNAEILAGITAGDCGLVTGFPPTTVEARVCVLLTTEGLIGQTGAIVGTEAEFRAGATAFMLTEAQILAVINGACTVTPGPVVPAPPAATVNLDLCVALLGEGLIDAQGNLVAGTVLTPGQTFGGVTLTADLIVLIGQGACGDVTGFPPAPAPGTTTGTLVVSKFLCPDLEEATATVSDPVPFAAAGGAPSANCVADTAFFQVFAGANFDSEPVAEFEAGQASVDLAAGTGFALFEPDQDVFFLFDIAADSVTTITVLNPAADKDGATPVAGDKDGNGGGAVDDKDTGGGDVVDDKDTTGGDVVVEDEVAADAGTDEGGAAGEAGADGADGTDGAAGEAGEAGGAGVTALPSTGQGADAGTSSSAIVLLFGAMSLVALAAGFAWRQRRTA